MYTRRSYERIRGVDKGRIRIFHDADMIEIRKAIGLYWNRHTGFQYRLLPTESNKKSRQDKHIEAF